MTQRGSAPILLIIIASVFGLGLIASAYLNYMQFQYTDQDRKQLQGQITDLQYQLKQNQVSPTPSTTPVFTPTPSATPDVKAAQSISLAQLGAKLSTGDPIADLTYSFQQGPTAPTTAWVAANLTTTSLVAKYPDCKPGTSSLGQIVRRPLTSRATSSQLIKRLGDYNYYYVKSNGGNCTGTAAGMTALTAARTALINTVLPTLSN
jgi:hypothetical protein